jgi:quercetin dioxygenase-like cupin family protein
MIFTSRNLNARFFAVALLLVGCVSGPHFYLRYGEELRQASLDEMLAHNPLPAGENIKVVNLGRTESASQHLVQIRDREAPHVHKLHDATVAVMRGRGYLILGPKRVELRAGDIVHIARGVPHAYVNTASEPTVALAVYAPAFDGQDTHPAELR